MGEGQTGLVGGSVEPMLVGYLWGFGWLSVGFWLAVSGAFSSNRGVVDVVSSPFQVTNCATLPFKPSFTASTLGKTSKANGASLKVNVAFPHPGPQANNQPGEANIAKVHVELPKALPSRLTTLQKACLAQQFDTNPAGCPAASIVGYAIAHTPILNNPLQGPAYFVSHGNEAFPQLIMVLQGEGIVIDLVGDTFISKSGITSSTFAHVPDAPVSSFELTLPEGKFSALAANENLCTVKGGLTMPTEFTAQNGAVVHQDTHIEVEGCSNTLSLISKRVKGNKVTLKIAVPAGGKLKVTGRGLSSTSKTAGGRETITVTVHQKKGGKLSTSVKVTFIPSKGHKQSKSAKLHFNK
jgi:hypothetical protein